MKEITVQDIIDLIDNPIMPSNIFIDKGPDKKNICLLSCINSKENNDLIIDSIQFYEENPKIILHIK